MTHKAKLSPEQLLEFQTELDALRSEVAADLGARDATHIRTMVRNARISAAGGRGLLMFGFDPISWVLGVFALAHAKILENMEVGHNVLHGQYDWMNDPTLNSQSYEWDIVCHSSHWRRTLLQPIWYALLAIYFQWGVGIQHLKLGRFIRGRMSKAELAARAAPFVRKARTQLFKDYVLFPLLAFWNIPRVILGNMAANLIRSLWTNAIIFCGHFTTHAQVYSKAEVVGETRGAWYSRQIQGSSNLEGSRWFHIMTGHLSHQIEHHLYPDIPALRYPEIAPRVREICARYGVHYNSAGFWKQYGSVLWRIAKYALPVGRRRRPSQVVAA